MRACITWSLVLRSSFLWSFVVCRGSGRGISNKLFFACVRVLVGGFGWRFVHIIKIKDITSINIYNILVSKRGFCVRLGVWACVCVGV